MKFRDDVTGFMIAAVIIAMLVATALLFMRGCGYDWLPLP